jgi:hypothetical protein
MDPSGHQIVTASDGRDARPSASSVTVLPTRASDECPFCPGNLVPDEVVGHVRGRPVLTNKYPLDAGAGQHLLLVLAQDHHWQWHTSHAAGAAGAASAWRGALDLVECPAGGFVSTWSSVGVLAGATQPHAHAQILPFATTPPGLPTEAETLGLQRIDPLAIHQGWRIGVPYVARVAGELVISAAQSPTRHPDGWGPLVAAAARHLNSAGPAAYGVVAHLGSAVPHVHVAPRRSAPGLAESIEGWHVWSAPDTSTLSARIRTQLAAVLREAETATAC